MRRYNSSAVQNLVNAIKRSSKDDEGIARPPYSLMTGFIGTAHISEALSANGQHDVAYGLLTQKTYPSWLYSVAKWCHDHLGTPKFLHH